MSTQPNIILLASENDALLHGKVGGLADVVRDLPVALAELGCTVAVITPSHGFLHKENPSAETGTIDFPFRGKRLRAKLYRLTPKTPRPDIAHLAIDADPLGAPIYFNDPPATPYKRDAEKYAAFCSAAGRFISRIETPSAIHLHDWHTGLFYLLRERHPEFVALKGIRTLFTIHNIAMQGTRPVEGEDSTLKAWFPELFGTKEWLNEWRDPQWKDSCFNPMLAGVRCADAINTVSPGYAGEILRPSDHSTGFYGGEGLEGELGRRNKRGELFGILNGCEYPPHSGGYRASPARLIAGLLSECTASPSTFGREIPERLAAAAALSPKFVLTAVTRIVDQKVRLFFEKGTGGVVALDSIAETLSQMNGVFIMIGSGDPAYESQFAEAMKRHSRFIFLKGYSEKLSNALYAEGTMFLMPSLFEPCGISQMIAMREGQPCLVHAVGGLKDTVIDELNGFTFSGSSLREQVDGLTGTTKKAVAISLNDPGRWNGIQGEALRARFTWETSAKKYLELLS